MKNRYWQAIYETYRKLESLCGPSRLGERMLGAEDAGDAMEGDEASSVMASEDLVAIRSELRTQLDFLKATLTEQYSERDTYLILFPIVAQIDEVVLGQFLGRTQTGWPSLQKELFQIENAGEVFFEILDDILLKPQTSLFIFEVYYFCLNYGFRGRYQDNPVKITTYMKSLSAKLEEDELEMMADEDSENALVRHQGSRWMGYLISVGAMAAVFFALMVAGRNML
ncbi:MAG: DotU family type IV/VI secretion system protein [Desulfobacterales bacterium]|nr:DotU family type IV/VI secretion system protein [Desulfobacterales bacterium]